MLIYHALCTCFNYMILHYFTKFLQGKLFNKLCRVIMGWDHVSQIYKGYTHPKERVENKKKTVSNDATSDHAKIVERRKKTYAEAVKAQNKEFMDERKQHLTAASSH